MRRLTIYRSSTPIPPRPHVSLNDMLRETMKAIHPPQRRLDGRQSLANQKVRDGRVRAAGPLEDALNDECEAGTTLESAMAIVSATTRWLLIRWGAWRMRRDLKAAIHAEQAAQCACDPDQLRLLDGATLEQKKAMLPKMYLHRETQTALIIALEGDIIACEMGEQVTQRHIAEMAGSVA